MAKTVADPQTTAIANWGCVAVIAILFFGCWGWQNSTRTDPATEARETAERNIEVAARMAVQEAYPGGTIVSSRATTLSEGEVLASVEVSVPNGFGGNAVRTVRLKFKDGVLVNADDAFSHFK
jgi:hypothetical protein